MHNQIKKRLYYSIAHPDIYHKLFDNNNTGKTSASHLDNVPYLPENSFLSIQNDLVSVYSPQKKLNSYHPLSHERGIIKNFSKKSSRRMKMAISDIDLEKYPVKFFATFTYHFDFPTTQSSLHRDLLSLLKRLERLFPSSLIVWRIELQKRGAPHFHLLIYCTEKFKNSEIKYFASSIKKAWGDITADRNEYSYTRGSDVVQLYNTDMIRKYLSKYCAKPAHDNDIQPLGRLWGIRGHKITLCKKMNNISFQDDDKIRELIIEYFREIFIMDYFYEDYIRHSQLIKVFVKQEDFSLILKAHHFPDNFL